MMCDSPGLLKTELKCNIWLLWGYKDVKFCYLECWEQETTSALQLLQFFPLQWDVPVIQQGPDRTQLLR